MIVKQLNLNYLSQHIGIDNFNLVKASYEKIALDGYFDDNISDKSLATLLFNISVPTDFFEKKENLKKFIYALPVLTQEKIIEDLGLDSVEDIYWTIATSDYFITEYKLDRKFSKEEKKEEIKQPEYFQIFEKPESSFKKLKEYQTQVFFKTYNYISETPFARCIVQMPTGSGKTRTAMEIICETINTTGKDVLWLANTEELCDQAYFSFIEVWKVLRKCSAGAINHLRKKDPIDSRDIPFFHVASLQSFNSGKKNEKLASFGIDPNNLELLIVDEAHISIAPTYKDTISKLCLQGTKLIGLTATPGRQLRSSRTNDENERLSEFYYNKKFEIDTSTERPIEYLRKSGILSNAKFVSIEGSNLECVLSKQELLNCIKNNTIPRKIEELLTNDSTRTAIIFDQLITLLKKNKKILFFGTSLNHSKLISTLITLQGFKAAHVDGNTGKYRSKIIKDFKENNLQILCNYGVLSTGFDDPKIDVVFMARPTNSIVLYSQIIGRGLRGPEIGGTDTTEIYTVFDNISDLPNNNEIYSYFDEYFIN